MKKLTLLACSLFLFAASGFAQTNDAPATVQNSFKAKYGNVQVKDWDWEDDEEMYEAEFKMNGKEYEAYFTADGTWMKTKAELKKEELPAGVSSALNSGQYKAWNMGDRMEMDTPEGKMYKVKVENKDQTMYLKYDANGKLVETMTKEQKKMKMDAKKK